MLRSHARNGNEFQTSGHRWLPAKQWDAWFLNSIKSKRNSRDLACYHGAASTCRGTNFVPFGAGLCRGNWSTNTYGDQAPFGSEGGGGRAKSGSRQYTRAVLPSFGPHGCVKPYCCLFVCIEFLLKSDGRCQTERESVPGVSNEPNWPYPFYVVPGPPFILSRGHRQVAT